MLIHKMQEILESIGLAGKEAALYLASLKIGTNPASIIAKEADIERSTAYSIIEKLKHKGYMMELKKGSLRSYTAAEPRRILNYLKYQQSELDMKIRELAENICYLDGLKTAYHSRPATNLLEGKNSIIYVYESILSEAKPLKTILSVSETDEKLKKYFKSFTERRILKKIPIKIIARENALDSAAELIKKDLCEIRFLRKEFAPNAIINIYSDKIAFISLKNEFVILIDNAAIAETFTHLFEVIWNSSSRKDPRFSEIDSSSSAKHLY
ncbi:hypothetical protein HZA39_03305 [Candidatus Peregrinibacteria bacterium]|nr:hypothetical protein [Candidatus Peregrinibacteria bacterium]